MGALKRRVTESHDPATTTLGDLAKEGLRVFCWCSVRPQCRDRDSAADRQTCPMFQYGHACAAHHAKHAMSPRGLRSATNGGQIARYGWVMDSPLPMR